MFPFAFSYWCSRSFGIRCRYPPLLREAKMECGLGILEGNGKVFGNRNECDDLFSCVRYVLILGFLTWEFE